MSITVPVSPVSPYTPTFPPAPVGNETGPDLTIFLLAHRTFRREFARLAVAAAGVTEHEGARVAAIEEQITLMTRSLHAHHTSEDNDIWPVLRRRDPAGAVVLDVLEREHAEIDPLIARVCDRAVPLRCRSAALDELSVLLNRHLDREEGEALPLMRRHFTAAEWEADGKEHTKKVRADLPTFVPTMIDHMSPAELDQLMADGPKLLVWLYKLSWRRSWAKRRTLIYG